MDLGLRDRVALVTGAGQSIGRQICRTLARERARIAVKWDLEDDTLIVTSSHKEDRRMRTEDADSVIATKNSRRGTNDNK